MRFDAIIAKYPRERDALLRLRDLAERARDERVDGYTLDRLFDLVHPTSRSHLAFVMGELVQADMFDFVIRVVSPTGGGIAEYRTLEEVPREIHDDREDIWIEVTPSLLKELYRPRLLR